MKHINISFTLLAALTVLGLSLISAPRLFSAKAMAMGPQANATTMVGTVSCLACRETCPKKAETLYSCTLRNVNSGSPYLLLVDDQQYLLTGNLAGVERFAGGKAAVHGEIEGSSIIVESVSDERPVAKTDSTLK